MPEGTTPSSFSPPRPHSPRFGVSTMSNFLSRPLSLYPLDDWYQVLLRAHRHQSNPDFVVESIHHYKSVYEPSYFDSYNDDKQNEFLYLHVMPRVPHEDPNHQPCIYILIHRTTERTGLCFGRTARAEVSIRSERSGHWQKKRLVRNLSWMDQPLLAPGLLDVAKILVHTSCTIESHRKLRTSQCYNFARIGYEAIKKLYPGGEDSGKETLKRYREQSLFFTIFGRKFPFALSCSDCRILESIVSYQEQLRCWRRLEEGG
ncbi:hypothetical protein BDN67DRAFT_983891 [Paxillus ammoniavirescens]|nr:hypothetical protein BDN67DRAFT_983891 [Paxillus ammoniavirescens]